LVSNVTAVSPDLPTDYEFFFTSYAACPKYPACKATSPDGSTYDLEALVLHEPITGVDQKNEWKYSVSVCQNLLQCGTSDKAGYCQEYTVFPVHFTVGVFTNIEALDEGKGVKLTYSGGTEDRAGTVTVTCNPSGPLVSDIVAISPDTLKGYQFNFKSSAACPKTNELT